jgi:hypothetical protein
MTSFTEYHRKLSQKGGKARALKLSLVRRREIARAAARARWKKNGKN